jgi:hypothetical protein
MKLQKVTMSKASDALVTAGAATVGFAGSNAGVKAVDSMVNNKWASKGIVAGLGLLGAIALPNKHLKAVSAGVLAKQVYDGTKELVIDHAADVEILADAFEVQGIPSSDTAPNAMAALRSAMVGRMGNPSGFQLGARATTENGFVAG